MKFICAFLLLVLLVTVWAKPQPGAASVGGKARTTHRLLDCEEIFSKKLKKNYMDGFLKISEFLKSTNLVLEKINKKLGFSETSDAKIKQTLALLEQANKMQDIALTKFITEYQNLKFDDYPGNSSIAAKVDEIVSGAGNNEEKTRKTRGLLGPDGLLGTGSLLNLGSTLYPILC